MRKIRDICADYLQLLRSENKTTLTDDEIDLLVGNQVGTDQVTEQINKELLGTEKVKGKLVQSERAFRIFCEIIVDKDISTGDPVYNSVVKEFFRIIEHNRLSNITVRRSGGKCVPGDTLIETDSGLKQIREVTIKDKVQSLDNSYKCSLKQVTKKVNTGKKKVYEIFTNNGHSVKVSADHPLLTINGWRSINNSLKVGDYVGLQRNNDNFGKNNNVNYAKVLGSLISEGNFHIYAKFYNQDIEWINELISILKQENLGFTKLSINKVSKNGPVYQVGISSSLFKLFPCLKNKNSYTVEVPKYILEGTKDVMINFLRYLFEGDGTVGDMKVEYYSMSYKLCQQVQMILNKLDIYCTINKKRNTFNGKKFVSYRLSIRGINTIKFHNKIDFVFDKKKNKLKEEVNKLLKHSRKSNIDVIERFGMFIDFYEKTKYKNFTRTKIKKLYDLFNDSLQTKTRTRRTNIAEKLLSSGDLDKLKKLSESDIFWSKIESIKYTGEEVCYDLQVKDGSHNFIGNGFYLHNSFFAALYSIFKQYTLHHYSILAAFNIPIMIESFFDVYREIVDNNELLVAKKFGPKPIWSSKGCIYNYGRIKGITLGSTSRSKHVNLVLVDDILGKTDGSNKYTNEDVRKFVLSDLLPIIDRKRGRMALLGTIDNTEDIYHITAYNEKKEFEREKMLISNVKNNEYYISAKGWCCVIFPAVLNFEKKEVLLPEVYTFESVMNDKEQMGDFLWYREMQQEIKLDKTALISEYVFNKLKDPKEKIIEEGESGKKYLIAVDPSSGEGEFSDFAAMTVLESLGSQIFIRYLWQQKHLPIIDPEGEGNDLAHQVKRVWEWFKRPTLYVENNSIGRILIQELTRLGVDVEEHNTGLDKVTIFSKSISKLKDTVKVNDKKVNKVVIPADPEDDYTLEMCDTLKSQATNYTRVQKGTKITMGGKGVHDDLITSLLIALHYIVEDDIFAGVVGVD